MSSKYNTSALKTFDNEVLEIAFEQQLITAMDMQQFAHSDYSLTEHAGMKKKIRNYVGTGSVKEVAMGEGNGNDVFGSYFQEVEYEVETTQGKGRYFDEQFMNDPDAVNKMVTYMREDMTNDMTKKIVGEFEKAPQCKYGCTWGFDVISDAIAEFPDEATEKESLFILVARADSSAWRKALGDSLKYVEAFVRRGYIGTVCGVPIYWNDAIPAGDAFIGTREAVTIYIKKGVEVEQERDADTRRNDVYIRKVMLVALTASNKIIKMTTHAAPTTTVTPECTNTNAVVEMNNQEVTISGFDVVAGVPSAFAQTFPLPCNNAVMVNLKGIIPSTGATIVQTNPALKAYYEAGDANIVKKGIKYVKTKSYDGSDANYQLLVEPKSTVTVKVGDFTYTIIGQYELV